jgi:Fe-S-cluster-containing hydrogenase component 2/CRP-like cAMP-binding protein
MPEFADPDISLEAAGREEESLFARDDNDVLIRREKETRDRFSQFVDIVIDGYTVKVPRAVPKTDAQGNKLRGPDGQLIPRTTTIHDAAAKLVLDGIWSEEELKRRIPVLCHQRHVAPVAVCRMCSVHVSTMKRGKLTPGRKLVPACQHRVETNMIVTTRAGMLGYNPDKRDKADKKVIDRAAADVNDAVKMLAEFLVADHCHAPMGTAKRYDDELTAVAQSLDVTPENVRERLQRDMSLPNRNAPYEISPKTRRFELPLTLSPAEKAKRDEEERDELRPAWKKWNEAVDRDYPYSSRTVVVDHERCILCDRCVRACTDVREFKVIGHTGKGYGTRISFDLDFIMGQSSCVQCGECMNSCPTGALSMRRRVQPRAWADSPKQIPVNPNQSFRSESGFLTADEIHDVWLAYQDPRDVDADGKPTGVPRVVFPFRSIPYSYLKWNEGAVRRWEIQPGERKLLCKEGEYGSTVFLLQGTGAFEISGRQQMGEEQPGLLGRLFGAKPKKKTGPETVFRVAGGDEFMVGELACLTQQPRTATITAFADHDNPLLELEYDDNGRPRAVKNESENGPMVVYEVTRNMLDMMQRSEAARDAIEVIYSQRAIQTCLKSGRIFAGLKAEDRNRAVNFLLSEKTDEGRGIEFRRVATGEIIVAEGDVAAAFYMIRLGTVKVFTAVGGGEQVFRVLSAGDSFGEAALLSERPGVRTASVAALDPVELIRVPGPVFRRMVEAFPQVKDRIKEDPRNPVPGVTGKPPPGLIREYVRQGLFQGQKLLVLDLKTCTRCDECTRACADSHDDHHARLLREGLRFGDFLVATSCRSCHKPYCMEGCPVDAIHREGNHLEVLIEDHCIGCGLCERSCPYGSIHMVTRDKANPDAAAHPNGNPNLTAAPRRRAVNCDLCGGNEPFCVQACPHEAAHRVSGPDLMDRVLARLHGGSA